MRRHLQSSISRPIPSAPSDQLALLRGDEVLTAAIESLHITEDQAESCESDGGDLDAGIDNPSNKKCIKVYLYKFPETIIEDSPNKFRSISLADIDPETSTSSLYTLETFPSSPYTTLWDSLQFDSSVKSSILAYFTAIFKFSLLGLTEQNEISFNRILLLHGPPGTGNNELVDIILILIFCRKNYIGKGTGLQVIHPAILSPTPSHPKIIRLVTGFNDYLR